MPLDAKSARLCIVGDSHLGAVKKALDLGLIRLPMTVEFWGATGPNFRKLRQAPGRIVPDPAAREAVERVNGAGRTELAAADFDVFLFYGARLRFSEFAAAMLSYMGSPAAATSPSLLRAAARQFLQGRRFYRAAVDFAAHNPDARVFFVPTSLATAGIGNDPYAGRAAIQGAGPAERAELRALLDAAWQDAGVTLLHQPEETITGGLYTHPDYAVEGAEESGDAGHKSPDFAALMLDVFMAHLAPPSAAS